MSRTSYFSAVPSGLWLPTRFAERASEASSSSYLQVKDLAERLEAVFAQAKVRIDVQSGIGEMIRSAKELSDQWLAGRGYDLPEAVVLRAAHLQNIAHVILSIAQSTDINEHLNKLRGAWDPLSEARSDAADAFWELQCLDTLRSRGLDAVLCEPPDIVVRVDDVKIGVACKKLYSEKSGEKQLSKGVAQTQREYDFGIVAVNLDALFSPAKLLPFDSEHDMRATLNAFNLEFFAKQEERIRQYMMDGRTMSAFASTGALVDLRKHETRLNTARWTTLWTIPELPAQQRDAMIKFKAAVDSMAPQSPVRTGVGA